jgi:hypothetical protein
MKVGMSTPNFHRSIEGVSRRVALTIPATFRLIATLDKHPCVENGRLNLAGTDSLATEKSHPTGLCQNCGKTLLSMGSTIYVCERSRFPKRKKTGMEG